MSSKLPHWNLMNPGLINNKRNLYSSDILDIMFKRFYWMGRNIIAKEGKGGSEYRNENSHIFSWVSG